jgi:hypothetical protein
MARFELNLYNGEDIEKTYAAERCPWGLYVEAADVYENIKKMSGKQVMQAVEDIMVQLFDGLTKEEMQKKADGREVMNLFAQVVSDNATKGSRAIKNA